MHTDVVDILDTYLKIGYFRCEQPVGAAVKLVHEAKCLAGNSVVSDVTHEALPHPRRIYAPVSTSLLLRSGKPAPNKDPHRLASRDWLAFARLREPLRLRIDGLE
jgi:hypothetical protein